MLTPAYENPVAKLLNYEEARGYSPENWPDYRQELRLTAEHIPALLQMAQDDQLWRLFYRPEGEVETDSSRYSRAIAPIPNLRHELSIPDAMIPNPGNKFPG